MASSLKLGAYNRTCIDRSDTKGHKHRGHVDVAERTTHRVLTSNRWQTQLHLHLQRTEQRRQRLTPRFIVGHTLEVLLIREAHIVIASARSNDLSTSIYHSVCCTMIGTPLSNIGVIAVGHNTCRIGIAATHRELLHRHLRLRSLRLTTVGHQHRRSTYGRIEHLYEALLRYYIIVSEVGLHALCGCSALDITFKRILILNSSNASLSIVLSTCRVDKVARKVNDDLIAPIHTHTTCICHISNVRHLHIFLVTERLKLLHVLTLDDYRHALLRLRDSELREVQTIILRRHAVEVYIEAIGELTNSYTHTASTKVVGLLNQACHITTTEQTGELALLGSIALLHLRATLLQRA